MRGYRKWRLWGGAGVTAAVLATGAAGLPAGASAATAAGASRARSAVRAGPVSPIPDNGTPALATTGTTEQIRQLVQCGGIMYAVGKFTAITWHGKTYTRNGAFSFKAASPFTMTSWNPDANGAVDSVALSGDCSHAYLGGEFTTVHGTAASNIAEVGTTTGAVVPAFGHNANGEVRTLLLTHGRLLAGGRFRLINGSRTHKFYAGLDPATGAVDDYLNLNISGHYVYPRSGPNFTQVYNQQLSPQGDRLLAEGVFTSVGGQRRQQIFMLDLGASKATLSAWNSREFFEFCSSSHPLYMKTGGWSADGKTVLIATTGFHLWNWQHTFPLTGLCDVLAAFPATETGGLHHKWINYTGCDSLYSVAADTTTIYTGGHERWADNPNGCNNMGPGAFHARGLGGFTLNGTLRLNAKGKIGLYTRGRGLGADDLLLTGAGLWVASDNLDNTSTCGGVSGHAGICFLPY